MGVGSSKIVSSKNLQPKAPGGIGQCEAGSAPCRAKPGAAQRAPAAPLAPLQRLRPGARLCCRRNPRTLRYRRRTNLAQESRCCLTTASSECCCHFNALPGDGLVLEAARIPPPVRAGIRQGALTTRQHRPSPTEALWALQPSRPASPKAQLHKGCSGQRVAATFVLRDQGHKLGCCVTSWPPCPASSR